MLGVSESKLILKIFLIVTLLAPFGCLREFKKLQEETSQKEVIRCWRKHRGGMNYPDMLIRLAGTIYNTVGCMILGNLFCPSQNKMKTFIFH